MKALIWRPSALAALLGLTGLFSAWTPTLLASQEPMQAATLVPAEEIRARFVETMGGKAVIESRTSSYAKGRFEMPAQGIGGDLEVHAAAPNRFYTKIEIAGMGTIQTGYDGEIGWSLNPMIGPMLMEGLQLDQMRQQADFYSILHPERYVRSAETVEQTEFEGKQCFKIKVVTVWDEEYVEFYDVETYLLAGSVRTQDSPMGPIEATSVVTDYGEFQGMKVPTRVVQRAMGQEQVLTIDTVEYDSVNEAVFELPEDIKALVAAKSEPPAPR